MGAAVRRRRPAPRDELTRMMNQKGAAGIGDGRQQPDELEEDTTDFRQPGGSQGRDDGPKRTETSATICPWTASRVT